MKHHFLCFRNVGYLRLRGRWVIQKSLEHYVQECMAFLNELRLSQQARGLVKSFGEALQPLVLDWVRRARSAQRPSLQTGHEEILNRAQPENFPATKRGSRERTPAAKRRSKSAPAI